MGFAACMPKGARVVRDVCVAVPARPASGQGGRVHGAGRDRAEGRRSAEHAARKVAAAVGEPPPVARRSRARAADSHYCRRHGADRRRGADRLRRAVSSRFHATTALSVRSFRGTSSPVARTRLYVPRASQQRRHAFCVKWACENKLAAQGVLLLQFRKALSFYSLQGLVRPTFSPWQDHRSCRRCYRHLAPGYQYPLTAVRT